MKPFFTLLLMVLGLAHAQPRPAQEVFIPSIEQHAQDNGYLTTIRIDFPDNYFLYADKTRINDRRDYTATPEPLEKNDTYLGLTHVWTSAPQLQLFHETPIKRFTLKTQGCEVDVICYPPMTFELEAPEPVATTQKTNSNSLFSSKKTSTLNANSEDFLGTEQAFTVEQQEDAEQLHVTLRMPDASYYLYRSSIGLSRAPKRFVPELPTGEKHHDPFLGEQEIYRQQLQFSIPKSQLSQSGEVLLEYQGCAEGRVCYPKTSTWLHYTPIASSLANHEATTDKALSPVEPTIAPLTPESSLSDRAINTLHQHYWSSLPLIFLLGIAMAFTACVYPLIPIVSSVVVGANVSTARAYRLIGCYVLGMGSALAILGALFALFQLNLQLLLQKTWIVVLVAGIFAVLALSMFGLFHFRAPSALQSKLDHLSRQQRSGSYLGALVMGALSVLMVSACSTPILTALLLYASQTNPPQGALALFVFGLGQGTPLFLFASALKRYMPKSGMWMGHVKTFFAFMLLAISVWLLARISSEHLQSALWGIYLLLLAVYLLPHRLPQTGKDKALWFMFLLSLLLSISQWQRVFAPSSATLAASQTHVSRFQTIANLEQLKSALVASDKPVLLDFFAQWCVSCHRWEAEIWNNPELSHELERFTLLKVDLTDTTAEHHALLQALHLVGPPAVLYYAPHASSLTPNAQLVGESSMGDFRKKLAVWR